MESAIQANEVYVRIYLCMCVCWKEKVVCVGKRKWYVLCWKEKLVCVVLERESGMCWKEKLVCVVLSGTVMDNVAVDL